MWALLRIDRDRERNSEKKIYTKKLTKAIQSFIESFCFYFICSFEVLFITFLPVACMKCTSEWLRRINVLYALRCVQIQISVSSCRNKNIHRKIKRSLQVLLQMKSLCAVVWKSFQMAMFAFVRYKNKKIYFAIDQCSRGSVGLKIIHLRK